MIEKNLRRIPTGEYLKDKKNAFLLYIKLQQISLRNPHETHRYIPYSKLNKKEIAKELKTNQLRLNERLKQLIENNMMLFKETETMDYYILSDDHDYYVTINLEILKILIDCCQEHVVRLYLKHKEYHNTYVKTNKQKNYYIPLETLAEECGLSKTNVKRITSANRLLEEMGILHIEKDMIKDNGKYKTINKYRILK